MKKINNFLNTLALGTLIHAPLALDLHTAFLTNRTLWKPPLDQSVARRHLTSNADCFLEPPQSFPSFLIISFLTVLDLAVLYSRAEFEFSAWGASWRAWRARLARLREPPGV